MMKTYKTYIFALILTLLWSCTEEFKPIDIFEDEKLDPKTAQTLPISYFKGANTLYANGSRIEPTNKGYHIKGTIFSESQSGNIIVSNGDFEIAPPVDSNGVEIKGANPVLKGYGIGEFPKAGFLTNFVSDFNAGSVIEYNTGKYFKAKKRYKEYPFEDNTYYFHFKIDQFKNGSDAKNKKTYKRGLKELMFDEFFADFRDPSVILTCDFNYRKGMNPTNTIPSNLLKIQDMTVGLSANGLFEFNPYTYSERMEEATGGTAFEKFKGYMFFSGKIPFKSYPIYLDGKAIFDLAYSKKGVSDLFERGIFDASYRLGFNGKLMFGHEVIRFLKPDLEVELAKATLEVEYDDLKSEVRFAGEYDSDKIFDQIFGKEYLKFLSSNKSSGSVYCKVGSNKSDYNMYVETGMDINIPGLGTPELSKGVIHITPSKVNISGDVKLPYGIGEVRFNGTLNSDGSFIMKGNTNCKFEVSDKLQYDAALNITLSNKGVEIDGNMILPYSIGSIDVIGGLKTDGSFYFSADKECGVNITPDLKFNSQLHFELSNSKIELSGGMDLPCGIGNINITGAIEHELIRFKGDINSTLGYKHVTAKSILSFDANTKYGVKLKGSVELPVGIGTVNGIEGRLLQTEIQLNGSISSNINFGNGLSLPAVNMSTYMSSASGISLNGKLDLPHGLGSANVNGRIENNGYVAVSGRLNGGITIGGVRTFSNSLTLNANSHNVNLNGSVDLLGLGNFNVGGNIGSGGYSLTGSKTIGTIDFGVVDAKVKATATITQSGIGFSANAKGEVEIEEEVTKWDPTGISSTILEWVTKDFSVGCTIDTDLHSGKFTLKARIPFINKNVSKTL